MDSNGICIWHQHRRDHRGITTEEAMKLRMVANTTTAFVRGDRSVIDLLTSMLSYMQALIAKYHVSFLDARIIDIVDYMISSDVWSLQSQSDYVR